MWFTSQALAGCGSHAMELRDVAEVRQILIKFANGRAVNPLPVLAVVHYL